MRSSNPLRRIFRRKVDRPDRENVIEIPSHAGPRRFYHRGSAADLGVIEQMFRHEHYSLKRLRRGAQLSAVAKSMSKPFILDAGANIGASVCWFAHSYPQAHIAAFEPAAENFALLRRNTAGLDVDLHQAALGAQDGKVSLLDPGEGEWGYRTVSDETGIVPLVSVSRIVDEKRRAGFSPFIAKIDIEGGEGDLFSTQTNWVDLFPLVVIELHDWLMPGQGTSRTFLKCIAARDRDFVHIGENIFSIRNQAGAGTLIPDE